MTIPSPRAQTKKTQLDTAAAAPLDWSEEVEHRRKLAESIRAGALYTKDTIVPQLDDLRSDVDDLQADVAQLQSDVAALQAAVVGQSRLINGDGEVDQVGTTVTPDDAYGGPDMWYSLTETASITASQGLNGEDGIPVYSRINQDQASAQRMGRAQIIESVNCRDLRGSDVVMSGRIRCSSSQAIRYAVLEHTGTADAVTSDVVNDWTSGTYTPGNFFIAGITVTGVGSITPSANTWTDLTDLTGTVSSSMNNLTVFLWTEGTAAQNVTLDFRLKLEPGTDSTRFDHVEFGLKEEQCFRYFERIALEDAQDENIADPLANSSSQVRAILYYKKKRIQPVLSSTAGNTFAVFYASTSVSGTGSVSFVQTGKRTTRFTLNTASAVLTPGEAILIRRNGTATAHVNVDARL